MDCADMRAIYTLLAKHLGRAKKDVLHTAMIAIRSAILQRAIFKNTHQTPNEEIKRPSVYRLIISLQQTQPQD